MQLHHMQTYIHIELCASNHNVQIHLHIG